MLYAQRVHQKGFQQRVDYRLVVAVVVVEHQLVRVVCLTVLVVWSLLHNALQMVERIKAMEHLVVLIRV
jgi:hypothetical protein